MKTEHQIELTNKIEHQMGIHSTEVLALWQTYDYLMDKNIVVEFWDKIKDAPAILIVGDYDVDGVCSSYIMSKAIKNIYPNIPVSIRIPKRFSEGYGINPKISEEIQRKLPKGSLIVTVDNGIAAAPVLEDLKAKGYNVIVTDHHELGNNKIPDVDMVINPKAQPDKPIFQGDYWCGAAVAYKIAEQMVSDSLKKELECFAGIATVADCMPLIEGNWGLVRRTMLNIREYKAPDSVLDLLKGLKQNPEALIEDSLGFYLCPAINAPGRLYDDGAKISLDYFLKPTKEKCERLVNENIKRRELRDGQLELLKQDIIEQGLNENCPIWVYRPGLHEGIVGILAGNIAEEYKVPAIVLTDSETEGIIKGSARSAGNINIFNYLSEFSEYFKGFGGHAGAAGLSLPLENLNKIKLSPKYQIERPNEDGHSNQIIMDIDMREIKDMADVNEEFRPFGEGNNPPKFRVEANLNNDLYKMVGTPPVHLQISDPLKQFKVMHFFHEPNELKNDKEFSLTGQIHYDVYKGLHTAALVADEMDEPEEPDFMMAHTDRDL